jgi:hypothetical protein
MALPNKNYRVDVFETDHVVPSQGYVINSTKRKLKPEYLVRRLPPHTYPTCNAEIVRRSRVHTRRLKCSAKDALKFGISDGGTAPTALRAAPHPLPCASPTTRQGVVKDSTRRTVRKPDLFASNPSLAVRAMLQAVGWALSVALQRETVGQGAGAASRKPGPLAVLKRADKTRTPLVAGAVGCGDQGA